MDTNTTIVHLSDLHIGLNGGRYEERKAAILDLIRRTEPDVVIVTGDIVQSGGSTADFERAEKFFQNVFSERKNSDLHIIVVPGNHDVRVSGFLGKRSKYADYFWRFIYPVSCRSEKKENRWLETQLSAILSILEKHGLAIFPLDSTEINESLSSKLPFAKGGIDKVDSVFRDLERILLERLGGDISRYSAVPKIAILHHHPLPVPDLIDESWTENEEFQGLVKPQFFLHYALRTNIELVLHGHKHLSGIAKYGMGGKALTLVSCKSSLMGSDSEREAFEIRVSPNGSMKYRKHLSKTSGASTFDSDPTFTDLVPYGEIRKKKSTIPVDKALSVESALTKKKVLWIRPDGTGLVNTSVKGIKWKSAESGYKREIEERFFADYGRIVKGRFEYGNHPVYEAQNVERWKNPKLVDGYSYDDPHLEDSLTFSFPCDIDVQENRLYDLFIGYAATNSFAINVGQHEEMYPKWTLPSRQEISSISVDYPTDFLQLIIIFGKGAFPRWDTIKVDVCDRRLAEGLPDQELAYLYRKYLQVINHEEKTFTKNKQGLILHREADAIELLVKYPQPGMVYTVRWALRDEAGEQLSGGALSLRNKVLKSMETSARIYDDLLRIIRSQPWSHDQLRVFLLGYDSAECLLDIVGYPADRPPIRRLRVGRGAAGKAFKTKLDQCWVISERQEEIEYPLENTVKDLKPQAILALPLKAKCGPRDQLSTVAVVSIVDETEGVTDFKKHFHLLPMPKDELAVLRERKVSIENLADQFTSALNTVGALA